MDALAGYSQTTVVHMKRGQPPKRYTPLPKPTKPIRARKKDPKARRWAKLRDPAYQGWIRRHDCILYVPGIDAHGCTDQTECAHVRARSTGAPDRGNCVPLCRKHHRQQHAIGMQSFQEMYDLNLSAVAAALDVQYEDVKGAK